MSLRRWVIGVLMTASASLMLAAPAGAGQFHARVIRTAHGIPHIIARDYKGVGYGYAYALASDNICLLADTYVTVDAQRSRYFGPSASYNFGGNGTNPNNLNSDFFYQRIIDTGVIDHLLAQAPPVGPEPVLFDLVKGYVAGYNRYLSDVGGSSGIRDPACHGKDWVKPITAKDVWRRFYQLGLLASQGVAIDGIAGAQPELNAATGQTLPDIGDAVGGPTNPAILDGQDLSKLSKPQGGIGSNAVALGSHATQDGSGMLLGNPHFPWSGSERFYQAQLTIPGRLNVEGGSLMGVPLINIGYTQHLAWSHTVSTAFRFTPFELHLVPGSPTSYTYDGQVLHMHRDTVTVTVRNSDGTFSTQTRNLYSSIQGPIMTSILGLPIFPWTPTNAYAMGDANANNFRYLNHFFEVNRAQSVNRVIQILHTYEGIPWVNTIAADDRGKALYADISVTPHVTDAQSQTCVDSPLGLAVKAAIRLPILDGSMSSCAWGSDPDSVVKGIFGAKEMPEIDSTRLPASADYVTNSNDSYWLANPQRPLTGFPSIIGDEGTTRSLRTRLGLRIVQQRLDGSDGLPGPARFTRQELQDAVFNDRQYAGELLDAGLVDVCRAHQDQPVPTSNGPVTVPKAACDALAAWDRHDNLNSRGAVLFRRFISHALQAPANLAGQSVPVAPGQAPPNQAPGAGLFSTPFSSSDPVNTPSGLQEQSPSVLAALGDAVRDLQNSKIAFDAPLGQYQYVTRNGTRIPIHGGPGTLGVFNAMNDSFVAGQGYPDVPHGSSYVQVVHLDGRRCPDARTILTYSQSTDPTSPWFSDQTQMYSRKQWNAPPFCAAAVKAQAISSRQIGQ